MFLHFAFRVLSELQHRIELIRSKTRNLGAALTKVGGAFAWLVAMFLLTQAGLLAEGAKDQANGDKARSASSDPVLVGAADIASCDDLGGAEATAKLIEKIP